MDEDGLGGIEERESLLNATARLEQAVGLIADTDVEAEVIVGFQIIDDLLCKVMHVHYQELITCCLEFLDDVPEQGLSSYPHQCLRHRVCQRFQPRSQSCGKDHRLLHILTQNFRRHL